MIKNIIFDFDGVIVESNNIKIDGFYELFFEFGVEHALMISDYFKKNAGLSRYDVIKYFFFKLFNEKVDSSKLLIYADKYSKIVVEKVIKSEFVNGCQEFLINNNYELFIVSSSDQNDLRVICSEIGIEKYFIEILGSPVKKEVNIGNILSRYSLKKKETIYIGDSLNDYYATKENDLLFIGRNSGLYDFNNLDSIIVVNDLKDIDNKIRNIKC